MKITFRRFDYTVSSFNPTEKAVLFEGPEDLIKSQFETLRSLYKAQEEARLVDIFDQDEDTIHFTRTSIYSGIHPNEDCYINLVAL